MNLHRIIDMAYHRQHFIDQFDDALKPALVHMCLIAYANTNNVSKQNIPHWTSEVDSFLAKFLDDDLKGNNKPSARKKALLQAIDNGDHLKLKQISNRSYFKFNDEGFKRDPEFFENLQPALVTLVNDLVNIIANEDHESYKTWISRVSTLSVN